VIVGVIAALALIGDSWGAFWFPWPLAIVALVAVWLLTRNSSPRAATPPTAAPYDQPAPAAAPTQQNPYAAAAPPTASYPPQPPAYYPPPPARTPNPRKRGPILFWFTLALIAVGLGSLGIADLAGVDVAGPAYPALAVGISGVMLLLGAFWGRAGGIILIGLLSAVALAGATIADHWDGDRIRETPTTAADVDSHYSFGAGDIVLDLREVADPANLDGRTIDLDGDIGQIKVIVPEDVAATISADIDGPGNIRLFNDEDGGIDINKHTSVGSASDPEITIDAQLSVGQIEVTHR
jgi:hypothetical protein